MRPPTTRHPEPSAPLWQSGFKTLFSALFHCWRALFHCQSALCYYRNPCAKSFGERCTLEGFPEGVLSPNAAKSASLVTNVPCRALCEGCFHQTILNNNQKCSLKDRSGGTGGRRSSSRKGKAAALEGKPATRVDGAGRRSGRSERLCGRF